MIVAHAPKTYFGSGDIQKTLGSLPGFPWAKYPGHNYTSPVNKNHLEDKISNVKRFFKCQLNNKNFVNDTKLQQEVKRLISFIQKELVNVANKTELQNIISLISKLEDNIAKQKLDIQQLIDNITDENEDTFQQELNALETKLNSELQKELTNIKKQIQNIDDSEIKTYIQQQIQNIDDSEIKTYIQQQIQIIDDSVIQQQITTINNLVLKQDKNIVALEKKFLKKESYYFNLPFVYLGISNASITNNIDKSKDYEYKKYGFTANVRVYSIPKYTIHPKNIFYAIFPRFFTFRGKLIIEINFPFQVKVDSIIFRQNSRSSKKFNAHKVLQFINGTTDFEYVKLYFVDNGKFTSIDIHKSQQSQKFLIRDDAYVNISIYIEKFSVHLNKINDSKEQISLVTVEVVFNKHLAALSEVHLI
ncbi:hypothetical protein LOTGIDRAFT_172054 [Lottia gigantea]|uniref:Uncharacterized protein n=1 Tax=Lottia gigantea TaxID=225164 RepID=V4B4J7_LOTGI|nr:hypothetical protein LOTGIDRAFT_172054 [Lottia gigantea]ESP02396.1 hypothetical protein LOTGIDRAFT_172054 [Lottia gigantea]